MKRRQTTVVCLQILLYHCSCPRPQRAVIHRPFRQHFAYCALSRIVSKPLTQKDVAWRSKHF